MGMKKDIKRYYQIRALFYTVLGFCIIINPMIDTLKYEPESLDIGLTYFDSIRIVLVICIGLIYFIYSRKVKKNNSDEDIEGDNREIYDASFKIHSRIISAIIFLGAVASFVSPDWVNSINASTFILCLFGIQIMAEGLLTFAVLNLEKRNEY